MADSSIVLRIEKLCFAYPQGQLFDRLSANIPAGLSLICGGEGRGKTTLLRLLSGEMSAHSGTIKINDVLLSSEASGYRQQVFWADPSTESFENLTPLQYFDTLRLRYPGFPGAAARPLQELLDGLGLEPHLAKPMYMLSTGSKRKVWLAAAFAADTAVTLLDDPFAALDKVSIEFVLRQLRQFVKSPMHACLLTGYEAPDDLSLALIVDLDQH